MAKIGRPPKGPAVKARLTEHEIQELQAHARMLGITRSDLIAMYIRMGMRECIRRYQEADIESATHTIELYRNPSNVAEGEPLEEWLSDHSLADDVHAWLMSQGLDDVNPDIWALVVPTGEGPMNDPFAIIPISPLYQGDSNV